MKFPKMIGPSRPTDADVIRNRQKEIELALIKIHGPEKTALLLEDVRHLAREIYGERAHGSHESHESDYDLHTAEHDESSSMPSMVHGIGRAIDMEVSKLVKKHLHDDEDTEHVAQHVLPTC